MKYVDEFRNPELARDYLEAIKAATTRQVKIMEVCGGQTHAIMRYGIQELLPPHIELVHGPGCPVCVTPISIIDKAISIAALENVIFCSFGDMLRVPGSTLDLRMVRARGGDVRVVYSPLDAVSIARENPAREVVFFAIGFETTAPANALAVSIAYREGLVNFSLLVSHVLVPPAIETILSDPKNLIQAFLAAGHVCAVMGVESYKPIASKYQVPIVVTGFEPVDILQGIYMCVRQIKEGRTDVENQYERAVRDQGNLYAQKLIEEVFEIVPREWRGLGTVPGSGWGLREKYAPFDAELRYGLEESSSIESSECISGSVLIGQKKPYECAVFGTRCTPEHPLGATMVSDEGACAAYYRYRKELTE